jgi:hypothetical protein
MAKYPFSHKSRFWTLKIKEPFLPKGVSGCAGFTKSISAKRGEDNDSHHRQG